MARKRSKVYSLSSDFKTISRYSLSPQSRLHSSPNLFQILSSAMSVDSNNRSSAMGVDSHTAVSTSRKKRYHNKRNYKMACSSSNNSNIRLKPRLCDCGRTTAMHIVRTNQNGNKGRISEEHCNYFKFADDNDDDVISNVVPRKSIRSEEFKDLSTRVYEMDNEFQEHGRRLRRMEKELNVMLYVIVFCIVFYFIM
ncbi:unnamed protein product [Camellia sinensis]